MRLTTKQNKALKLIAYFIRPTWDMRLVPERNTIEESPEGVSPEQAFFDKSDKGISHKKITNKGRYLALLYGHRWMTYHEKAWREGFEEGVLLPEDFNDAKDYANEEQKEQVVRMAQKCAKDIGRRFDHV